MTMRFENIDATTDEFHLPAGEYTLVYDSTNWLGGSATLQRKTANGDWVGTQLDPFSKDGSSVKVDLGGTYRVAIDKVTGLSIGLVTRLQY
jgi:hypothetical protein